MSVLRYIMRSCNCLLKEVLNLMKRFCLIVTTLTFILPILLFGNELVTVEYFFSKDCPECQKVTKLYFPALQEEKGDKFKFIMLELGNPENFQKLLFYLDTAGDKSNEKMYAVVNQKTILGGAAAIENKLSAIIDAEYASKSVKAELQTSHKTADRFTLATVLVAGFIDGINPCVFATFILFISFLATGTSGRKQVFQIGVTYLTGCFLTYFTLGLGLYQVLNIAVSFPLLRGIVNGITILVLLIFAVISFGDAIRYKLVGVPGVVLQLPQKFKDYIRKIMRSSQQRAFVLSGVFVVSVLVTIVESACSGQVYVPTLLYLANNSDGLNQWWGYLLLYNLMFLVPLLLIFAIALYSIKMQLLTRMSKLTVVVSKTFMGLFFLALAGLIGYFEFYR